MIPDFNLIEWNGRKVLIAFDANAKTNLGVKAVLRELVKELIGRGAIVSIVELPEIEGINGIDDLLGLRQYLYRRRRRTDISIRAHSIAGATGADFEEVKEMFFSLMPEYVRLNDK